MFWRQFEVVAISFCFAIFVFLSNSLEQLGLAVFGLSTFLLVWTLFFYGIIQIDAIIPSTFIGTITLSYGGPIATIAVLFFFISGTFLSRIKRSNSNTNYKDKRRDGIQVWSNLSALFMSLVFLKLNGSINWLLIALITVASSTADTWGSEIGRIYGKKTYSFPFFKLVEKGTDGGISLWGTLGSVIGSALIALLVLFDGILSSISSFLIIFIIGFLSSMIDSLLGTLFQTGFMNRFEHAKSWFSWIGNNEVNALATHFSAFVGTIILFFL